MKYKCNLNKNMSIIVFISFAVGFMIVLYLQCLSALEIFALALIFTIIGVMSGI